MSEDSYYLYQNLVLFMAIFEQKGAKYINLAFYYKVRMQIQSLNEKGGQAIIKGQKLVLNGLKTSLRCKVNQYKLIFHSKSILLTSALSQYLYSQLCNQKTLTLLISLSQSQVDQIFNNLITLKSLSLLQNKPTNQFEVKRLSEIIKGKRAAYYRMTGVMAVSQQIILTDLIRIQRIIDVAKVNRIVVRINNNVQDHFNYLAWIFTILKLHTTQLSVLILCYDVQYYKEFQSLQKLYRTFFCQKFVIWPFGRSQIHKSLSQSQNRFSQIRHHLQKPQQLKQSSQIINQLILIIQKQYNKNHQYKSNIMQVLYKESIYQQIQPQQYSQQRQYIEFRNLKFILTTIQNCDSLQVLCCLLRLKLNQQQNSIWNSNNSNVLLLIQELQKIFKYSFFTYHLTHKKITQNSIQQNQFIQSKIHQNEIIQNKIPQYETTQNKISQYQTQTQPNKITKENATINKNNKNLNVDLVELIKNYHYDLNQVYQGDTFNDWQAFIDLDYTLQIFPTQNHKSIQTQQIIDVILNDLYKKQTNHSTQQIYSSGHKFQDIDDYIIEQNMLIIFSTESSKKYFHKELFSKINDCQYIEFLKRIHTYLNYQRQIRILNIKSIYNKVKVKKYQLQSQKLQQYFIKLDKIQIENNNQLSESQYNKIVIQAQPIQKASQFITYKIQNVQSKQKQNKNRNKKSKKPFKLSFKQNKYIVQQMLFNQLTQLFQIVSRYQNQIFSDDQIRINRTATKKQSQFMKNKIPFKSNIQFFDFDQSYTFFKQQSEKKNIAQNDDQQMNLNNKPYKKHSMSQQKVQKQLAKPVLSFHSFQIILQQNKKMRSQFLQQIQNIDFNFIFKPKLKLSQTYTQTCEFTYYSKTESKKRLLNIILFAPKRNSIDSIIQFNQTIKLVNPHRIIFYSPHVAQIRNLYLTHAENQLNKLKQIHVITFKDGFQVKASEHQVKIQDQAFWKISQNRLKLSQYKQNPQTRIKQLQMKDKFQKTAQFLKLTLKPSTSKTSTIQPLYHLSLNLRRIIIDSREFKSLLPCYLYYFGFNVIPITLITADYILSDEICIEKKAVHTKDLQTSLKSGRLDKQIRRMCQQFKRPYLLIECQTSDVWKKESFYQYSMKNNNNWDNVKNFVRRKLAQLIKKHPKLKILWADSVQRTCQYFKQLKRDQPEPDVGKYMKNDKEQKQILDKDNMFDSQQSEDQTNKQKIKIKQIHSKQSIQIQI